MQNSVMELLYYRHKRPDGLRGCIEQTSYVPQNPDR